MPQCQDFGFQPRSRLEAVAQHTDEHIVLVSDKPFWRDTWTVGAHLALPLSVPFRAPTVVCDQQTNLL